ncbi:DUF6456 domain-containing protein [Stappia sp. P2PMeth1]|uniref:DUF6456 domain-containing protein n=1 Tax=Stappia sp. P2PMeth1 TaxID=2003586 RepID=UPI001647D961|nr:DUF6456 domain-containing protein [Stappia sp. P2PMeth1]
MAPSQRALDRLLARLGTAPAWQLQQTADKSLRLCAMPARRGGARPDGAPTSPISPSPASPSPVSPSPVSPSPAPSLAPSLAVDPAQLRAAFAAGLVERGAGCLTLSPAGRARLRRLASGEEDFAAQHREIGTRRIAIAGAADEIVTVNHAESPLAWLRRRRGRDGEPILDEGQFAAGERLRADHAFGAIVPGMRGMAWSALGSGAGGGTRDPRGGLVELTDATLAARARLERAIREVGPELAGVLIDVCCELKGLEQVERERRWPPRSAKVVLLLGLTRLARHYGTG